MLLCFLRVSQPPLLNTVGPALGECFLHGSWFSVSVPLDPNLCGQWYLFLSLWMLIDNYGSSCMFLFFLNVDVYGCRSVSVSLKVYMCGYLSLYSSICKGYGICLCLPGNRYVWDLSLSRPCVRTRARKGMHAGRCTFVLMRTAAYPQSPSRRDPHHWCPHPARKLISTSCPFAVKVPCRWW